MDVIRAIKQIKEEKINVVAYFHKANGDVRAAYLCTKQGSEVDLDASFFSQYKLEEDWSAPTTTELGYIAKSCTYKISDKNTNEVIYSQN